MEFAVLNISVAMFSIRGSGAEILKIKPDFYM